MPFENDLILSTMPDDGELFRLKQDLIYRGRHERFLIPAGFTTDLATVPAYLTWLAPRYGLYTRAAVLHDFLCVEAHAGRFSRADADGLFRRVMRELNVSHPRRWMMWGAVRAGGRFADGVAPLDILRLALIFVLVVPFMIVPALFVAMFQGVFFAVENDVTKAAERRERLERRWRG